MIKSLKSILFISFFTSAFLMAESIGPFERSLASDPNYLHGIQGSIGLDRGKPVLSADYEYKLTEHFGFGGTLYFTPANKDKAYPRIFAVGVDAKIHAPLGDIGFYVRPGLSFAFIDFRTTAGQDDDSVVIAPFAGVGAIYRIADNVGLGFEYLSSFNWTDEDLPGSKHDFLIATQIKF